MAIKCSSVACGTRLFLLGALLALPSCSQARDGGFRRPGRTWLQTSRCPTDQTLCPKVRPGRQEQACVSLASDQLNCGACGAQCTGSDTCISGVCSTSGSGLPSTGGSSAAASISLGSFDTCDSSGNALTTSTRCGDATAVPAVAINITKARFESLAVYKNSAMCLRVSTCLLVNPAVTTSTVLSWAPPERVFNKWPAAGNSCSQSNCRDGTTLSQMLLPNSGRDETVWLTHPAGSCLSGVSVQLTVSPECTL